MILLNGDCIEILQKFVSTNSVDCFILDLPDGQTGCSWDKKIDLKLLWKELKRTSRNDNTPFFFFTTTRFGYELIESNKKWFRYDLVVEKTRKVGFMNSKRMPLRNHEMIYVFYNKTPTYNYEFYHKRIETKKIRKNLNLNVYNLNQKIKKIIKYEPVLPSSILKMHNNTNKNLFRKGSPKVNMTKNYHPTEKSIDILEWIIKYYTNEGDTVLDPTMGCGSTGVACDNLNRKFIGIEKDKKFYDIAVSRINGYKTHIIKN